MNTVQSGETSDPDKNLYLAKWVVAGAALAIPMFLLALISHQFSDSINDAAKPVILLVGTMVAAGALYFFIIVHLKNTPQGKSIVAWVIFLGLLMRLSFLGSTPMLEDDHYRYLWDGGVLANGVNPYKYSPFNVQFGKPHPIPDTLRRLAKEYQTDLKKINYPSLRTIYPPIAELTFALAHMIAPWSLVSWRLILLVYDLLSLYLLWVLLSQFNLSWTGLVIYWWNPLLVKEIYNSGHMDVLLFPFILLALLMYGRGYYVAASGLIGLAVGVKLWPVIFLPIILRPLGKHPKIFTAALLVCSGIILVMLTPFYLSGLEGDSGLTAYGRLWEMNDFVFLVISWIVRLLVQIISPNSEFVNAAARVVTGGILVLIIFFVIRSNRDDPLEISRRFLLATAALFFLSPTQFPWYGLWLLPLMAIFPLRSLLILTVLLPLYYLRFYLAARGYTDLHDNFIVWLEFGPSLCWLLWEIKGS